MPNPASKKPVQQSEPRNDSPLNFLLVPQPLGHTAIIASKIASKLQLQCT